MAVALRPAPDFLMDLASPPPPPALPPLGKRLEEMRAEIGRMAAGDAGETLVQALRASLADRLRPRHDASTPWNLEQALAALDPKAEDLELFGALRLLQAVQPQRERIGYSHIAEEDPVRIDQQLRLDFPPAEVAQVAPVFDEKKSLPRTVVTQNAVGLLGPNGALPFTWTEFAHELAYSGFKAQRDGSFLAFVNLIQRRQLAFLFRAWHDSNAIAGVDRPQEPHPVADRLRALAGLQLADSSERDSVPAHFKSAFAAVLSKRVRSPQALAAMLAHFFDAPVRVEEFVARWLEIPQPQRTMLGVQFTTLGEDAVAGARVWDCSTRFRIYLGPLDLQRYRSFLPHGEAYAQLADLVGLYCGVEYEWELVPVLQSSEVPYSWLGNRGLLLGWSSWLGVRYETQDAADLHLPMIPNLKPRLASA